MTIADEQLLVSTWLAVDTRYSKLVTDDIAEWCDAPHGEIQLLDPLTLTGTQDEVSALSLERVLSAQEALPPIAVVVIDGVSYIDDGHNRAVRAVMRAERVRAYVYKIAS